jgi:hypothetical protein
MRDPLTKLAGLVAETTLDDLKKLPVAGDPVIAKAIADKEEEKKDTSESSLFMIGDDFGISIDENFELDSRIIDILEDGIVIELDDFAMGFLEDQGFAFTDTATVEAEYQGRKVSLGKRMQGDVKKSKVYVKNPKTGNVIKINFGDKKMKIKKSNPKRRKSFRARHNCATAKDRTTARYWSCRSW